MTIKIYVACLASYNSGHLFGAWFDLKDFADADDLRDAIERDVLRSPKNPVNSVLAPCEEFAIHDFEAPKGVEIKEYSDLDELFEMNEVLSDDNGELILALKDHLGTGTSLQDAKEYLEENHCGEFKSDIEFADDIAENSMGWDMSTGIGRYFDSEAFARDLMFEHFEIDGHYFRSA